jgi:hypothetical protein
MIERFLQPSLIEFVYMYINDTENNPTQRRRSNEVGVGRSSRRGRRHLRRQQRRAKGNGHQDTHPELPVVLDGIKGKIATGRRDGGEKLRRAFGGLIGGALLYLANNMAMSESNKRRIDVIQRHTEDDRNGNTYNGGNFGVALVKVLARTGNRPLLLYHFLPFRIPIH